MMIEGRVLNKCGMKVDRISLLPDELVVHILSLLPLKTSVSTSILSRRWLHLWKYTTKLVFRHEKETDHDEVMKWVKSVLKSHRAPSLQELTIDVFADFSDCPDVAKWLDFAFSRRVETLSLYFINGWPDSFSYCAPRLEHIITLLQPSTTSIMRSLKALRLLETKTDGEAIMFFLKNCPFLEELVIRNARITSDLELVGPSLQYLELQPKIIYNSYKKFSIQVSAPNLTQLKIGLDTKRIVLENVPKLVDMVLIRCNAGATMHGFAAVVSRLETVSISINDPETPFWIPEMPKLKKLVIDICYHHPPYGIVPFPVTSFLRASPCLQEFQVKFVRLALEEGETDQGCHTVFQHSSLKRFKLLWSCGGSRREDCIKLVSYVVKSCVALEQIEISQCSDDGTKLLGGRDYIPVDDVSVRVATTEERTSFENTTQLQLPGRIKLRMVNHSHKST